MQHDLSIHDAMWKTWFDALDQLSPEQIHAVSGSSFGSIFHTLSHMVAAEYIWQERLEQSGGKQFRVFKDYSAIKQAYSELRDRRMAWLRTNDLSQTINYQSTEGKMYNSTARDIVWHMMMHAHFHRGQLVDLFRMLSLSPPSDHPIYHLR